MSDVAFEKFPSIARYSREIAITEKIDGTNAQIEVFEGGLRAGSRQRWITPDDDNFGFARWVLDHHDELLELGDGRHYGEWWGSGIQRRYGLTDTDKRFSLFNTGRWTNDPDEVTEKRVLVPGCVNVVPLLYWGLNCPNIVENVMTLLKQHGSLAAPGFMNPEGVVWYHTQGNFYLKKTFEKDDGGKNR